LAVYSSHSGGVTLYHGFSGLLAGGHILGDITPAIFALSGSLFFELVTMGYAYSHIKKSADLAQMQFWEYLRCGADPTSVQVFMEDVASVMGIAIAATCMTLSKLLALPMLDSVGSICIGVLLSSVAMFLIRRNISSLTEAALDPERENQIVDLLLNDPVVKSVHDIKSTSLGPDWARFKGINDLYSGDIV
jgi:solute carrier family 30 (zinc transporter), member 9